MEEVEDDVAFEGPAFADGIDLLVRSGLDVDGAEAGVEQPARMFFVDFVGVHTWRGSVA